MTAADPYSAEVRRLFADPAHAGRLDDGTSVRLAAQGIDLELSMRRQGDRIAALRFRARGCPHLIAAAEATCRDYEGRPVATLRDFRAAPVIASLPVPIEKTGLILVLEDAVRSLGT